MARRNISQEAQELKAKANALADVWASGGGRAEPEAAAAAPIGADPLVVEYINDLPADQAAVQGRVHDALHPAVDTSRSEPMLKAAAQAGVMNGGTAEGGVVDAAAAGWFDNPWRYREGWQPIARPIETLKEAGLGGVVRAIAENMGAEQAVARRLEQWGTAGVGGAGATIAAIGLHNLLNGDQRTPGTLIIR